MAGYSKQIVRCTSHYASRLVDVGTTWLEQVGGTKVTINETLRGLSSFRSTVRIPRTVMSRKVPLLKVKVDRYLDT